MELHRGLRATLEFDEASTVTITRDSDGKAIVSEVATDEIEERHVLEVEGSLIPEVDVLTVTWTDEEGSHEKEIDVVGGFVVSIADVKAKFGGEASDAEVSSMREIALREIEDACGVAFRQRYRRELLSGRGTTRLLLHERQVSRVLGVEVEGEALSEAEIEALTVDPLGVLIREEGWPAGRSNVVATYVYGYTTHTPAILPVRDYAAYLLTPSPTDWDGRATSKTNEDGTFALVTPGVRGASFPLPVVNAFVERFATPMVA